MMKLFRWLTNYFTKGEAVLLFCSVVLILVSFLIFDRQHYLTLAASLVGALSLILCAKGNPLGQLLMIVFSILYGIISYSYRYYGEMITYLGMTAPMALFSLIVWLRHPFQDKKTEVEVRPVSKTELLIMLLLTAAVTAAFYFLLKYFHTANLILSTVSVATSFLAVCLTFRRSPYYAVAYSCNDLVLIVLWSLAALSEPSYLSVTICFVMFLINDAYGFVSWNRMFRRQQDQKKTVQQNGDISR